VSESSTLRDDLRGDLLASVAVVALVVPQALAYALLAGVPPALGLLASFAPPLAYALFVGSRYLAVGPVALVALVSAAGLETLATPGSARYVELASLLSLEVGLVLFVLGLVRAGVIANFFGHPATLGFNAAAAILTAGSQVRPLCGLPMHGDASAQNPWPVLALLHHTQLPALALGLGTLALVVWLPRKLRRIPAPLVACILGIVATAAFGLRVETVGAVPTVMPTVRMPSLAAADVLALVPTALTVAVVAYGMSIAIAKALANRQREHVDPNAELRGLGAANVISAVVGAFPVAGSFARSMLTLQAGGRTRKTGVFVAGWVALVALGLSSVFAWLPLTVLAAIVIQGALSLVDVREARSVWRTHRSDAATMIVTFAVTLAVGLVEGLAAGLLIALILFVARSVSPHTAELGRIPGSMVYRNTNRFAVEVCPQIGILRVDAPLYFANARFLEDRIHRMFAERPQMKLLALDCSAISDVDATAIQSLRSLVMMLRGRGNDLHLIGPIGPVRDVLARTGMVELLGEGNLHRTIVEAAPVLMARIDRGWCEGTCRVSAFPDCTLIPRSGPATERSKAARFSPQI
jgi:sulfate permease, SulP family